MYIAPISSNNFYSVKSRNISKTDKNQPSFTSKEQHVSGNYSTLRAHDSIVGNANIDKLVVLKYKPFIGFSTCALSLNGDINAKTITSDEECIEGLYFNGNSKVGRIDKYVSEIKGFGNYSIDTIDNVNIFKLYGKDPILNKIGEIKKAHCLWLGYNAEIGKANTNMFNIQNGNNGIKTNVRIGDIKTSGFSIYVKPEDYVNIDNLTVDVAKGNKLKNDGYKIERELSGNIKIGNINFVNGEGDVIISDSCKKLPDISNIKNGKLIYELNNMREIDKNIYAEEIRIGYAYENIPIKAKELHANKITMKAAASAVKAKGKDILMEALSSAKTVEADNLIMNNNASVQNAIVTQSVKLSDDSKINNLTVTGKNGEVYITGNASVSGKIIFPNGNGKVYLKSGDNSSVNQELPQIVGGEIVKPVIRESVKERRGIDKIIGMEEMKELINDEIIAPIKNPEKYKKYGIGVINGFMMYGPPGCGKTFVAKAIAEETGRKFYEIGPSSIGSVYQFESQQNIKSVFESARRNAPSVIFIDEAESILPKRDLLGGDNNEANANVTEILQQMNNCIGDSVLVILACNEPQKIDNAVKRTGRIDKKIYVGEPDNKTRIGLFRRNLEGIYVDNNLEIEKLAEKTPYYTADDIRLIVRKAAQKASKTDRTINQSDLEKAITEVNPSLSKDMVEFYKNKINQI